MPRHKATVLMNQIALMLWDPAGRAWRRRLAMLVYLALVISSLVILLKRAPDTAPKSGGSIALLALVVASAHAGKYLITALLFYIAARARRRQVADFSAILSSIVVCGIPELLLLWLSILIPGFDVVDHRAGMTHAMTGITFYLRGLGLPAVALRVLSIIEFFTVLELVLRSLLLSAVSGLRLGWGCLLNLVLGLGIRLIPV
jgi:hypothetical protein